ncbi:hypothetical protein N0V90_008993 [Kalmusia sp. IMI 367209]|nr:hypothetical protein N0V90_008993 [Kalmusia sp. IMI 367209]
MAEYTSTKEGFQRAMKGALTSDMGDSKAFAEATVVQSFYHVMNGQKLEYEAYVKSLDEWRGKISHYEPVVNEFLRDGDQLAARMTGTIKVDGSETFFESFMFGKVDGDGKIEYLIERSVWGPIGGEPVEGVH